MPIFNVPPRRPKTRLAPVHSILVSAVALLIAVVIVLKLLGGRAVQYSSVESGNHRVLPTNADQVDLLSLFLTPAELVAVPEQALQYSRVVAAQREFGERPTFNRFVAETALQWDASLVLVSPFVSADTRAQLDRLQRPVLELPPRHDHEGVIAAITTIGAALDMPDRADKVIAGLEKRVSRLESRVKRFADGGAVRRAVSYVNYGTGGWGAGEGLSVDYVIRAAGLVNAARELKRPGAFPMSFEDLITLDPDYIVLSAGKEGRPSSTEEVLRSNSATSRLRAVREDRFLRLPATLTSASSQEMITAAELLHDLWVSEEKKRAGK